LAKAFDAAGYSTAEIGIAVHTPTLSPQLAWQLRHTILGHGDLTLVCNTAFLCSAGSGRTSSDERFWQQLWRLRNVSQVCTAFWPVVSSACPLFMTENAADIVPGIRLQAPSQSAWMTADIELSDYVNAAGRFDVARLRHVLEKIMNSGEDAYDVHVWPTPSMQQDAWLHRRLAICLNGIGDLVQRLGLNPNQHASLQAMNRLLLRIRQIVQQRSRQIARSRETLPGIRATSPCRQMPGGIVRAAWEKRWRQAIRRSAVRHRNLLVMSPWSLFPAAGADVRFMNLLPLLRHADACRFDTGLSFDAWNVNEIRCLHQRSAAVVRSIRADALIAERL
jgi:hypothetical protein